MKFNVGHTNFYTHQIKKPQHLLPVLYGPMASIASLHLSKCYNSHVKNNENYEYIT